MLVSTSQESLATKAKLFRGLSDASRLSILEVLREGPLTVSQIVEGTGLLQANTSNHLSCLLDCGLVEREQQGRFAIYRLADDRTRQLLALGDDLLTDTATGVYACRRNTAADEAAA